MDTNSQPVEAIEKSFGQLGVLLENPQFYSTLFIAGVVITVAWLIAFLIQRSVKRGFAKHPPKRIDTNIILKPLQLLAPVLAVFSLGSFKPLVEKYGELGLLQSIVYLTLAYIAAKATLLVMKSKPMAYFISTLILLTTVLQVTGFLEPITSYFDSIAFGVGKMKISLLNVVNAVIGLIIVFYMAALLAHTLESYLRRSSSLSYNMRELTVKLFKLFLYFLAFILALSFAGIDLTAFAVFGGAIGVGLGFGLQQLTSNFISGITLLAEKSIRIGDLVEIGAERGWIRQLNARYLLLETPDGREMFIPNADFVSARVINWTHSNYRARISFEVGVAYGTDPNHIIQVLTECASQHPQCLKDPEPAAFLTAFADSSLTIPAKLLDRGRARR